MRHPACFVVVRDGVASARHDDLAALNCVFAIEDGPQSAVDAIADFAGTDALPEWAAAEAGYLLDFDERLLIVFGPRDGGFLDEFGFDDEDDAEADAGMSGDEDDALDESIDFEEPDPDADAEADRAFLAGIAHRWIGWKLVWDERGVDAFAAHLARRGLNSPAAPPPSHPGDLTAIELDLRGDG